MTGSAVVREPTASTVVPATTGSRASRAPTRSRAQTATTSCPAARAPTRWPAAPVRTGCRAAPARDRLSDVAGSYAAAALATKRNRLVAGPGRDRVDTANGRRDVVHCGSGRDAAVADREDTLAGCERRRFLRSPMPEAAPPSGGRQRMFMVRFRALEEVASAGRAVLDRGDRARGLRAHLDELAGHPVPRRRHGAVQADPVRPRRPERQAVVSRPVPRNGRFRAGAGARRAHRALQLPRALVTGHPG